MTKPPMVGQFIFYCLLLVACCLVQWLTQLCLIAYQDSVDVNAVAVWAKCIAINAANSVAM